MNENIINDFVVYLLRVNNQVIISFLGRYEFHITKLISRVRSPSLAPKC